jgi:hypothetical protein
MRWSHSTQAQSTASSLSTDQPHGRVTSRSAVRSLTGCQVTSPSGRFSRYSNWSDTFRTALVHLLRWKRSAHILCVPCCFLFLFGCCSFIAATRFIFSQTTKQCALQLPQSQSKNLTVSVNIHDTENVTN